jgi:DNA-binding response OmpR family regulator
MIKQNVNILGFNSLYVILEEIKDNLPFNITRYENETDFLKEKKDEYQNSLIITILKNSSLDKKKLLIFNNLPISIDMLIEEINISLIKLKFNLQSKIDIKNYVLNLNSKFLAKNTVNLKLTEKEIEIILYINTKKIKHSIIELQKNIWGYSSDLETHTVETHIYRLRKKIKEAFGDENFILSHEDGYYIE